ncbi:MAG: hypothetical protein ACK5H0_10370 [Bacteroidota bacterium]|jgi:hypothetical protein
MNSYQSMELHHGAFFPRGNYTDNQSAIDGGLIKFHDSDDVSSLPEFQGPYGVPIEIDRSYLDLILNAKKLNISLDFSINTIYEFDRPRDVYGAVNVTGSFDRLALALGEFPRAREYDEGQLEYGQDTPYFTFFKALVQKRNLDNGRVSQIHPKRYSQIFGSNPREQSEIGSGPILFPSLSVYYSEWNAGSEEEEEDRYYVETSESYSQSTEKAGSFDAFVKAKSPFAANDVRISVCINRVIITPTKVYAVPFIEGRVGVDLGAIFFILFSTNPPDTVSGLYGGPLDFLGEPSTVNVFGKPVTVYFYSNYSSTDPIFGGAFNSRLSPIITSSSSFDITKEEAYPETP